MQYEIGETHPPTHWFLAYTEPRREVYAQGHLDQQGYITYLPLFGKAEAMFPRYLFFRPASASQSIAPVRSTRGVQAVVRFGSTYASVSDDLITAIRKQERLRAQHATDSRRPQPGQRVRVNAGAPMLEGLEGLVHATAARRVIVLMEILGRQTSVGLPAKTLEII